MRLPLGMEMWWESDSLLAEDICKKKNAKIRCLFRFECKKPLQYTPLNGKHAQWQYSGAFS